MYKERIQKLLAKLDVGLFEKEKLLLFMFARKSMLRLQWQSGEF